MNNEWQQSFLKDLEKNKNILLNNCHKTSNKYVPMYVVKEEFFDEYFKATEQKFQDPTKINPYLKFSSYQEYRIIKLISSLNKAKNKYYTNQENMKIDKERENTSPLIITNDIIKNSYELTTYVYLADWLHSIYLKDDPKRTRIQGKPVFVETVKNLTLKNKSFDIDYLNNKNSPANQEDIDNYNKILEVVIMLVRSGKLKEAQETAEYHNLHYISAMLNGGLPLNDFLIDEQEQFENVDFDLFPPNMKTRELFELKEYIQKHKHSAAEHRHSGGIMDFYDGVIGNPNWLLWIYSNYQDCEIDSEDKNWQIKYLQSYLSGNSNVIEKNNNNVYESLYVKILGLLNSRLVEEYTSVQKLEYHYSEGADFSKFYSKLRGKSIRDVINSLKSQQAYIEAVQSVYIYIYNNIGFLIRD